MMPLTHEEEHGLNQEPMASRCLGAKDDFRRSSVAVLSVVAAMPSPSCQRRSRYSSASTSPIRPMTQASAVQRIPPGLNRLDPGPTRSSGVLEDQQKALEVASDRLDGGRFCCLYSQVP